MNRLQWYYRNIATRDLLYKSQFKNIHQIPQMEAICLNISSKNALIDRKKILQLIAGLEILCGQKLRITYAKRSIAGFKLRQGQLLGAAGTLRGSSQYYFLDKLVHAVLPKIRDFQGISGSGSFSGGHFLLYPELENHYELFESVQGFNITCKAPRSLISFVLPTF